MYEYSLEACLASGRVGPVVVAVPPGQAGEFAAATDVADPQRVRLVDGGATRSRSVAAGLALIGTEIVLVQDAARPMLTPELIDACVEALEADPGAAAAIAAAKVTDTVKRVGEDGVVEETLDRSRLRAVQTPQVFRRAALAGALESALASGDVDNATDDAFLIESAGGKVIVVDAPSGNIKVTVPEDLRLAEMLINRQGN
jgi:2-C-methyl-D-erythritol 4-phosphate cytidylyltransferase